METLDFLKLPPIGNQPKVWVRSLPTSGGYFSVDCDQLFNSLFSDMRLFYDLY